MEYQNILVGAKDICLQRSTKDSALNACHYDFGHTEDCQFKEEDIILQMKMRAFLAPNPIRLSQSEYKEHEIEQIFSKKQRKQINPFNIRRSMKNYCRRPSQSDYGWQKKYISISFVFFIIGLIKFAIIIQNYHQASGLTMSIGVVKNKDRQRGVYF